MRRLWISISASALFAGALAACANGTESLEGQNLDASARDAAVFADASVLADATVRADAETFPDAMVLADAEIFPDAEVMEDAGALAAVGEACAQNAECASSENPLSSLFPQACITFWPNGYCADFCTLPADALAGPVLVRADCPANAICIPRSGGFVPSPDGRDDIGICVRECDVDADCRTDEPDENNGYYCRKNFYPEPSSSMSYQNGYCAPAHCGSRGCPGMFRCEC